MPAKDINKLKRERAAKAAEVRAILDAAEARDAKQTTPEEETRIAEMLTEIDRRTAEIETEERLQDIEKGTSTPQTSKLDERSFGEFLQEVRFNPNSNDLQVREVKGETRDMTAGNGPSAGFLIPTQHDNTIREVTPQQAIFRPRAMVLPAGDSPDAAMDLIALDQSGTLGVYSGVVVRWLRENAARQDAGDPRLRTIKLEPQEVSGYIDVSDKLLRNAPVAGALVQKLLRGAIIAAEETAFYRGDGVGKPLGIVGHPATVTIPRAVANQIGYLDLVNMLSRQMSDNAIFIANRTILPQLMTIQDPGGRYIWQPNAVEGQPKMLLGSTLLYNQRSPVLGVEGDLALVDLDSYCIKDGSSLAIFIDPYTQKVNGVTRIYAFWNVDGQPMMNTPMLQEDGVTTVSPNVVLR